MPRGARQAAFRVMIEAAGVARINRDGMGVGIVRVSADFCSLSVHLSHWINFSQHTFLQRASVMDIDEEILARVLAAKAWDRNAKLEDFQIKAAGNGYVLINLKTRRAQLIYDEFSELHDLEQILPEGQREKD